VTISTPDVCTPTSVLASPWLHMLLFLNKDVWTFNDWSLQTLDRNVECNLKKIPTSIIRLSMIFYQLLWISIPPSSTHQSISAYYENGQYWVEWMPLKVSTSTNHQFIIGCCISIITFKCVLYKYFYNIFLLLYLYSGRFCHLFLSFLQGRN